LRGTSPFSTPDCVAIRARNPFQAERDMAQKNSAVLHINGIDAWRIAAAVVLIAGLAALSGTRASDCMRAASYCLRTRNGPAVSMRRLDQESSTEQDPRYELARAFPK
jgi:hypothetical protein